MLLGLILSLTTAHLDDDWSRLRGPGGEGHASAQLPEDLSLEHVLWRAPLPGDGHSSPVVSDGHVLLTCVDEERGKRAVVAHALHDGSQVWRHDEPLPRHRQHGLNSYASSTAALGQGRAHLLWTRGSGQVEALTLDLAKGTVLWRRDLGGFAAQHGSGVSPVLAEGVLLVANEHEGQGSFLLGLDPATGKEHWRLPRTSTEQRASYTTPTLLRQGDRSLALFASTAHGLTAVEPRTGEVAWEYDAGFEQRCVGAPTVAGNIVFQSAGSGGGGKEYVALRLPAQGDRPTVAWSPRIKALPYVPTPIAHGGLLFLVNDGGIATCLDASTGAVRWQERLGDGVYASPVLVGERLLVVTREGLLLTLAAGASFELLGTLDLGVTCQATPAVSGGRLLVRAGRELIAFRLN